MNAIKPICAAMFIALTAFGSTGHELATDYLSVPGPLLFDSTAFNLAWSSHPSPVYYKHEYIPEGETPEHFNRMLLLEAVTGSLTVNDAITAQVQSLEERKKSDPTINYQVFENRKTGERMVDFIVSESSGGAVSIVEWNAYRYVDLKKVAGTDGVLLFAYSKRAYDDDITDFFTKLKTERMAEIQKVVDYTLPRVTLVE